MPAKKKKAAHSRPKGRKPARKRTKRASLIRSLIIALACVLGVLAVIVAGGSLWMWQKLGMVDYDDSSTQYLDSLPPEEEDDLLLPEGEEIEELESSANSGTPTRPDNGLSDIAVQGSEDGITNILLLGIDAESGYVGRSDVMMLLSIDKNRKTIRLISFLRDTLITIPGRDKDGDGLDDYAKLNAAYAYGRTGTKAERQEAYQASLRSNHIIGLLPYLHLKQDYIKGVLEDYAGTAGSLLTQTTYALEGDVPDLATDKFDEEHAPQLTLVITMGTPGVNFNVDDVFNQILDAYSMNVFTVKAEGAQAEGEPDAVDLQKIYDDVCVEPVDATVNMQTFKAIPGSYGYVFDMVQAQKQVSAAQYGEVVRVPMEYVAPEILDDDVFFRDVLGSTSTPHSNNANRTANLELACKALNGVVLNPGETFSFNDTLGERTTAKGYKSAPAYSGDDLVNQVGGGICQVSSTLYCSTLLADLEIVSRTNHGFPVNYINYGMDATVSWRSPDFKFRNNTNYPIKIEASVSGGYVNVQILGTDEKDYYVEMSYVVSETYKPETEYKDFKPDNPEGYKNGDVIEEGTTGYLVKTYKSKYDKATGVLISKDFVANSRYKTVNKVVARVEEPTEPTTVPTTPSTAPSTEPATTPTAPSTTPPTTPSTSEPSTTEASENGGDSGGE